MEPANHILVVEGDAAARDAMKPLLEAGGYSVNCVTDGREALAVLAGGQRPIVILLDAGMPAMDAWRLRREQRQTPHLADIPVLAFSPKADPPATGVPGMAGCSPKTVGLDGLLEAIRLAREGRLPA